MTYLELFAGGGGLSHGLDEAGWTCLAHAEIEKHARAVLREHWPDVPLLGDVTWLDGVPWKGVLDVVSGGSPCQDLSVAGKRAGLVGARSSLFHHHVRFWNESGAPYLLWENVPGALSSNEGADFAVVLSTIVGGTVLVPSAGWSSAGVVSGPACVAAWRVFDLQYFGPPQRRARLFVVSARGGGIDPAEILALGEKLCRHPPARAQTQQDAAGIARGRAGRLLRTVAPSVAGTLGTMTGGYRSTDLDGIGAYPLVFDEQQITSLDNRSQPGPLVPSLNGGGRMMAVVGVDLAPTLTSRDYKGPGGYQNGEFQALIFPTGRPRRLMPVECERVMGWPDGWTQYGISEDGSRYALTDTARYRIIGNGVGSPVATWIASRMAQ